MFHKDLVINHRLESWVYANAAARNGATGFVSGDIGRIAYQLDTGQYWRLINATPTWQVISSPAYASVQTARLSPASTVSTLAVMMGLGTSARITPTASGKVFITVSGTISNAGASINSVAELSYGLVSGGIPANGAALTGTLLPSATAISTGVGGSFSPLHLAGIAAGLSLGVEIWIDVNLGTSNASGAALIGSVVVVAAELP